MILDNKDSSANQPTVLKAGTGKLKFGFLVILILVILLGLGFILNKMSVNQNDNNVKVNFLEPSSNQSKAEIAAVVPSLEERKNGLSGRESLDSNSGMLYVFSKPMKFPYWMKGMKFPLDLIWVNGETVVDFETNLKVPFPGQPDEALRLYIPRTYADKVIEVNAGFVDKHQIKIGDKIIISN